MASQQVTLQALGLNYSPNSLSLTQGSLVQANNVIIRRDNTIESRRGLREYSEGLGLSTDRPKQLIEYKERILCHYSNKLAFDTTELDANAKSIFDDFSGSFSETQVGLRIKSIEANKNLYFTTSEGIKKISAKTASDFSTASGFIRNAGAVKALDITATLDISQGEVSGFLPNDSAVAYRVVWGYKDNNDNLLLGTPSNRVEVYNYLQDVVAMDLDALNAMLDSLNQLGCMINDGNYASSFYSPINTEAVQLKNNVIGLAQKLDAEMLFGDFAVTAPLDISTIEILDNEVIITVTTGDPTDYIAINDWIEVKGVTATGLTVTNGNWQVTDVTSTTIKFLLTNANVAAAAPGATTQVYGNNYRNITATGDAFYNEPLDTLDISVPATSEQVRNIHNVINRILERLKVEKIAVIPATLQTTYIVPFLLTSGANTKVTITIPTDIDSQYFVQVYRTRVFTADGGQSLNSGGLSVIPDDEMRLVFEEFPTSAEISAGQKIFFDSYPEALVQNNTNLYTNPETGEGLINANEPPPFAKDINRFKNVVFYANTRTKQQLSTFQLLGISDITSGDKITIASVDGSDTYTFVSGAKEITDIACTAGGTITSGDYFNLYSASDNIQYAIYYIVDNIDSPPVVANAVLHAVNILSADTDLQVAQKTIDSVNTLIYDFVATDNTLPAIRITNVNEGLTTDADAGTSPFTVTVFQQGNGEDASLKQVLLSSLVSAAQAIDQTAQSLVRIINKQSNSVVSAYYISGENSPPGQINLQAKTLDVDPFYVIANNDLVGFSFNPDISPMNTNINSISIAASAVITTSTPHGLVNDDQIIITNTNSTPDVDGVHSVTVINSTSFSVPVTTTVVGNQGSWSKTADSIVSTNDVKPNRIYYSKLGQPEAVPLLNYFDISAEDKEILRIFPLRDTLFAFKEDGTYRISGAVAPFNTSLLDSSCIVIAPDSVAVTNNIIYAWTSKGITPINENGANTEISRPIDTEILRLTSSSFPNFKTLTWGMGYDSDSSYVAYTNSAGDDESAMIGFRYCTLTNTWTNFVRSQTCGLVLSSEDTMYMGSGEFNLINKERKEFTRKDYADKDFKIQLGSGGLFNDGRQLQFTSVDGINVGDVITQEQTLTTYGFNSLLSQLDNDPTVGLNLLQSSSGTGTTITITTTVNHTLASGNYINLSNTDSYPLLDGLYQISNITANTFDIVVESPLLVQATSGKVKRSYENTLPASSGDNMRDKIEELAQYLDTDPGLVFNNYFDRIDTKSGSISSNSIASPTVVTTSAAHELVNGRIITIGGTQSPESIPVITGTRAVASTGTFGSSTQFTIAKVVTTAGGSGLTFDTAANLNSFEDIMACYNDIVSQLNTDTGATFNTYQPITETTLFESAVLSVNKTLKKVVVNLPLQWVVGPMTVYNAIECRYTYAPITMEDPLMTKQIREATVMMENRAITKFTLSFSSDLKPEYFSVDLYGQGNGIFGHYSDPGFGYGFFGGESNSAPFRTLIPAQTQRCRYLNMSVSHSVAREKWSIYGITLTGKVGISARGYR